ncbi:MAG: outer membrane protein assembly factor BamB [Gammaproteobacteria bacterium]|nr:outer membrane protein assembly factor BamB [Gammaproteobacteria bacterium]
MNRSLQIAALLILALVLSACSWFGGKDDDKELEPLELVDIETTLNVTKLWSAKLGDDAEFLRVNLRPAGDGNRIYAASRDGNVIAFDPLSGKKIWTLELDTELSAGPGVGDGMLAVGSADGTIIALNASDGTERWRTNLGGETLSAPLIGADSVVVATVDNLLRALRASDGNERWAIEQSTPILTMRGSASPALAGRTVIAGFDNGRLMAVDIASGDTVWDVVLAPPSGRSDLERLSDIDGQISVVGQDIYAGGYQGRLASLAVESGQVLWAREISSYVGVAADWNSVYTTSDNGEIIALSRRTGQEAWRQTSLLRREPTVPVIFGTSVVVGDLEGYLHFFSVADGTPVARLRFGKAAISAGLTVIADRLYAQNDAGSIAAYAVQQPRRSRNAPDVAADAGT